MKNLKQILGYDRYFVSDEGEVFSYYKNGKVRKLNPRENIKGYLYVNLSKEGSYKSKPVHKLVADSFLEKQCENFIVNHKDGNKLNNKLSNLEFISMSENSKHAFKNGLASNKKGEDCNLSKLTEKQVIEIRLLKGKLSHREISEKFNISKSTVTQIINRTLWKHI
jgi:predicted transcriptional regulator